MLLDSAAAARAEAEALDAESAQLTAQEIVAQAMDRFGSGIAVISSFGADSAVLLHMIANVDRSLPVLFLDTGKHFEETIDYRDALVKDFGLTDLRIIEPKPASLAKQDPAGTLHARNPDACCAIRKVEPMARAVEPFRAWFTGRKRFQTSARAALPVYETVGPRVRVNPLARWSADDIADYARANGLRPNPLVAYGYLSIGCFPCTRPVEPGGSARDGRWAGFAKVECGIHLPQFEESLAEAG